MHKQPGVVQTSSSSPPSLIQHISSRYFATPKLSKQLTDSINATVISPNMTLEATHWYNLVCGPMLCTAVRGLSFFCNIYIRIYIINNNEIYKYIYIFKKKKHKWCICLLCKSILSVWLHAFLYIELFVLRKILSYLYLAKNFNTVSHQLEHGVPGHPLWH